MPAKTKNKKKVRSTPKSRKASRANGRLSKGKRKEIDEKGWQQMEALCQIQCTAEEIASVMKLDVDTITARIKEKYGIGFSEYINLHAAGGRMSLRRWQFDNAKKGNASVQIWLGKQYLNQKDKVEHVGSDGKPIQVEHKHDEIKVIMRNEFKQITSGAHDAEVIEAEKEFDE